MEAVLRWVNATKRLCKCPHCGVGIKPQEPYAVFEVNGILVARCLNCAFFLCMELSAQEVDAKVMKEVRRV